MVVEITSFRKYQRNSLQAFLNLLLTNVGLEIKDCTLHSANGKKWIGLPAKPYDKEDGSTGYSYIIKFPEKDKYAAFQKQALRAVEQYLATQKEVSDEDIPF